jgi:beta-N-acetylhexosaminidase
MTVEERVGQLFLVAFVGNDPSPGTEIAQLIRQDHVGGVVLLAANANFTNGADTPRQVAELTNGIQALAMGDGAQVPLFVAVDHEGDGYPYTRITGGTTPLPNAMAVGATWDPANARAVGQVTGLELTAMGINLLLGPGIDVLQNPKSNGQGGIDTRSFGGDPWWVGEMGRAYIEGIHRGSSGRVATVAKHFPGHGGADRLPADEVTTVDKSLEELRQVELAPFMAVTQDSEPTAVTDALMSSHIRYRGLQGDVRQFTAPISFDAEGMAALLGLEEFVGWRRTGLMVSDSLGLPAVRKYFDPTLSTFPQRRIAKEAFLAGNDLLLLTQFDLNDNWADQFSNTRDTVAFFREEYRTNPAFAERVDESVARILHLKLRLYPEFALEAVQVHPDAALQVCGLGTGVTQRTASQALTLLYPDHNALPSPPQQREKILIFTDARPVRECPTEQCQPFSPLSQTAVEEAILRFYGPGGTGQVAPEDIASLPFGQLKAYLSGQEVEYDVETLLQEADWILFAQQDLNLTKGPNSDVVKLFLNHSLSATYGARLVVLAFNAPYYLDTTEISKLSLYLGAYSKVEPFVEAAVRALFGESVPQGAPPVGVEGISYDLQRQLSPAPGPTIPLTLVEPGSDIPVYSPVDARVQAGPILDRNGHVVPDGTEVTFYAQYDAGTYAPPSVGATTGGLAEATLTLSAAGRVHVRAESDEAHSAQSIAFTIQPFPTDTPVPTRSPVATPTEEPTRLPTASPTIAPSATPIGESPPPATSPTQPVDGISLLLAAGTTLLVAWGGYLLLGERRRRHSTVVRWLCLAVIGGMLGYILYTLAAVRPELWEILPEAEWVTRAIVMAMTGIGALVFLVLMMRTTDAQG